MVDDDISRRLRGAFGNALVWGADGLWAAAFGSVVASGSIKLAQLSDRLLSDGRQP